MDLINQLVFEIDKKSKTNNIVFKYLFVIKYKLSIR